MKRLLAPLLLLLLALPASATWSIVVVDTNTGEVGIVVASCTPGSDLHVSVPVMVVGKGGAVFQANGDSRFKGRPIAWDVLRNGGSAQDVIDAWLAVTNYPYGDQVGAASHAGSADSANYTGSGTFAWSGGVVGAVDGIHYAIQGNILVGQEVVLATEAALIDTPGDLGQKMIAAMEAGTALGGDGRCSCSNSDPTGCGVPPPNFQFASKSGFLIVSRIGDLDGVCDSASGCANGTYYLDLDSVGTTQGPDAVLQLRVDYDQWRAQHVGHADGILSTAVPSAESLPADGRTTMRFDVRLVDLDGAPITSPVESFTAAVAPESTGAADVSVVAGATPDAWTVEVTGTAPGDVLLDVVADDAVTHAQLYPRPCVRVDPVTPLHVGVSTVDAATTAVAPFAINVPESAGAHYILLASLSGTDPGIHLGGVLLPLNFDETLSRTWRNANNGGRLVDSRGVLSPEGYALAEFRTVPGLLANLIGQRIDWAVLTYQDGHFGATNAVGIQVVHGAAR